MFSFPYATYYNMYLYLALEGINSLTLTFSGATLATSLLLLGCFTQRMRANMAAKYPDVMGTLSVKRKDRLSCQNNFIQPK